jgi:hypothetical protein
MIETAGAEHMYVIQSTRLGAHTFLEAVGPEGRLYLTTGTRRAARFQSAAAARRAVAHRMEPDRWKARKLTGALEKEVARALQD